MLASVERVLNMENKTPHPLDAVVGLPTINVNEITLGDSLELCERIPAKTVDLILEDMPYNTTACEWDVKIDLELYWKTRLRILKPTGTVILTATQPFTTLLGNSNLGMLKYDLVWLKPNPSNIFLGKIRPLNHHENILIFANGRTVYNAQKEKRLNVNKRANKVRVSEKNIETFGECKKKFVDATDNLRLPKSVLDFARPQDSLHPTQKPVGLFEYLIRTYSNEGDLVFDGFGGSGTTAIAAHKSKRNFIVIEKEKKYFDLAKRRLDIERAQLTML